MTPSRLRRAALFLAAAALAGCRTSEDPESDPPAPSPPPAVSWLVPPGEDRVKWMDVLDQAPDPAARELIRIHMWDPDEKVGARAFAILEAAGDEETVIERWLIRNPDADVRSDDVARTIDSLLSPLALELQARVVARARMNAWRAEFSGLLLSDAENRLRAAASPLLRENWVKSFRQGDDGAAMVAEDGVSPGPKGEDSGMRSVSPSRPPANKDPWVATVDKPFPGAWALGLSRTATGAVCGRGKWFAGSGTGFLVRGSMSTGDVEWGVAFPIPPDARLELVGEVLKACWTPVRDLDLVLEFSESDGVLRKASFEPPKTKPPLGTFRNGDTLACGKEGESWTLSRKSGDRVCWARTSFAPITSAFVGNDDLFVAADYMGMAVIARLNAADGSPAWCRPLARADQRLRFACIHEGNLWLIDGDSSIFALEAATGALLARNRWCATKYSNAVVNLAPDEASGRFLLDPSSGYIYGVQPEALLRACALPEPDRLVYPWDVAFGNEVNVQSLNLEVDRGGLFDNFSSDFTHGKFSQLHSTSRDETWKRFADALVAKAAANGIGAEDLTACLATVEEKRREGNSYAPTSALRLRYGGEEAWVIICNWENVGPHMLAHIAIWAVSVKTHEVLGFETCD